MFGSVINEEGYIIAFAVLDDENIPRDYVLKEHESIVKEEWSIANAMCKPKWDGVKWIESATQEEIDEFYNLKKPQPTSDEILRAKLIKDNASMQLQLAQQQKLNADILLKIANLGGSTNV